VALPRRQFLGAAFAAAASSAFPATRPSQSKIDIHVHLGRDRREMEQINKSNVSAAVRYLIGEMDKHHVDKSLIVPVEPLFPTDVYLEAAKLEPERLMAACSVLPRPSAAAVDKLKSYQEQGAKALKLQPLQYDPHDPAVERLVAEAVKLGMPVLFHHLDTPKGFPEMLSHLASTFPTGNFVVVHFGGVYGFWDVLPLARQPNVYLETSTAFPRIVKSPLRNMLHFLAEEKRLNKLIFGSELPGEYENVFAAIDELLGESAAEDVVKAVYKRNADRILGISLSSRAQPEEEDRERREKVSEIFSAMAVREGSRVADVGAGGGFHTVRLARAVGRTGRVYAVDISERQVKQLKQRMREDELENVEIIQGETKDPKLPANSLDAVLISDAYHEMTEYPAVLSHIRQALKPGGRFVVFDRIAKRKERRKDPRQKQVQDHEIAPELVEAELRQAGFEIVELRDPFLDRPRGEMVHWLMVARRPAGP
jgi:predicted TIM-barrel fold metal-dependent hydrolase/16S rRNA G527 N7-methylase RsmG